MEVFNCSLCQMESTGWGNNPYPLCEKEDMESQCCDKCNVEKVIPARMGIIPNYAENNGDDESVVSSSSEEEDEWFTKDEYIETTIEMFQRILKGEFNDEFKKLLMEEIEEKKLWIKENHFNWKKSIREGKTK